MSEQQLNVSFWSLFKEGKGLNPQRSLGRRVTIPDFQRNYSWGKKQVEQLYNDILSDLTFKKSEISSFGIVIGIDPNQNSHNDLEIVDGQQRLATLQILALSLHWHMKELANSINDNILREEAEKIKQCLFEDRDEPKFVFNYDDKEAWKEYTISHIDSLRERFETLKGTSVENPSKIDNSFKILFQNLDESINKFSTDNQKRTFLNNFWFFVSGRKRDIPGIRFLVLLEQNPLKAIERFDRENNRGLGVRLDDLVRSFIIESIHRKHKDVPNAADKKRLIKTDSKNIVQKWSKFVSTMRLISNSSNETLVKWFILYKIGYQTLKSEEYANKIKEKLVPDGEGEADWDPIETTEEIVKWAETYKDFTNPNSRNLSEQQKRLDYFNQRNLRQIWGFLIPLRLRIEEESLTEEIESTTKLPDKLLRMFEYVSVVPQLTEKGVTSNAWNPIYARWRGWLGQKETYPDVKVIIDEIYNELTEVEGSKGKFYKTPSQFFDDYNQFVEIEYGENTRLRTPVKTTHARLLYQASRHLSGQQATDLLARKIDGNHLEHIFPESSKSWLKTGDLSIDSLNNSLLTQNQYNKMVQFKQHIGNHTILFSKDNIKLRNATFYEKKWGPKKYKIPGRYYIERAAERPSYKKYELQITKSLIQHKSTFTETFVKQRGNRILVEWMKSLGLDVSEIDENEYAYDFDLDVMDLDKSVEDILESYESPTLEFKAGFWARKSDGSFDMNDKVLPLRIAKTINGMANSRGGKIILGRQDRLNEAQNIVGIEDTLHAIDDNFEAAYDKFMNTILPESMEKTIPRDTHSDFQPVYTSQTMSFGKKVIIIEVEKLPDSKKPMPFVSQNSRNFYFVRNSGRDTRIDFLSSESQTTAEEDIYRISDQTKGDKPYTTLGPFESEKAASKMNACLETYFSINSLEPKFVSDKTSIGGFTLALVEEKKLIDNDKTKWKGKDSRGNKGVWIIEAENLPKDWQLPNQEFYELEVIKDRKKESKWPHECPACGKTASTLEELREDFGIRWMMAQRKYAIQSQCRTCRRG